MTERKTVLKITDEVDRREVYATTYQLRNPFQQFADAVITELDVFNYFSLAKSADLCPQGGKVLDICSGRGLLLPFLRYRNRQASVYVGVDIEPKNAIWKDGKDPRRRRLKCPQCSFDISGAEMKEWGIEMKFVHSAAEDMVDPVQDALLSVPEIHVPLFDHISYTSSIEHMQPDAQRASLMAAGRLAHRETTLYLTCPVTEEGKDGYETQYAAHIYEPSESELDRWLREAGWFVHESWGLVTKVRDIQNRLSGKELREAAKILDGMPRQQALPTIAFLFPETATEKAYLCRRTPPPPERDEDVEEAESLLS